MIEKFLRHVLPDSGIYCLAVKGATVPTHITFDNIEELTKESSKQDASKKDVFFAVGSLKDHQIWEDRKTNWQTGGKGAWAVRTHANINQLKALILDIDCNGTKSYEYPSQQDGLNALQSFVKAASLPPPTIINSGRGLHVYWTFTEAIDAEVWYDLSLKASAVYSHFGLRVDPSRVKDRSSVLRVAGTHHYKDPSKVREVKDIFYGQPTEVSEIERILDKYIAFHNVTVEKKFEKKVKELTELEKIFQAVKPNIEEHRDPIDINLVFSKCQQMARVKEVGGPVGYNIRASAASIIKCSEEQDFSVLWHKDENVETVKSQTDAMLADTITDNPHTCITFANENKGGCNGCEYQGKIKSPVVLGRVRTISQQVEYAEQLIQPEPISVEDEEFRRVEPPYPYTCSAATGVQMRTAGDENVTIEQVYEYELYPYERIWDYHENAEVIKARVHLPHDSKREFVIPGAMLADTKSLSKLLANNGIIAQDSEKSNIIANYMSNYIRELQKNFRATTNYAQLGWHEDSTKFVLPDVTINEDGSSEKCGVSSKLSSVTKSFRKRGTLEAWKKIIATYEQPGYEPYAFGHLVGYGSILFEFTDYKGAIVNMIGNTGSGKSTVLKTINSIFGHPEESMLMQHDKYLARMNRIGIFNSISITYDEITKIPKEELSDLCYSISQGRGRHRLNQDASEKDNNTSWKMIMACSSNASLYDILGSSGVDSSAEAMRVFEYRIDRQDAMKANEAKRIFSQLNDNFGHAGEIFVKYVSEHREEIKHMIAKVDADFEHAANVPIQERYWSNVVACCIVGGVISKRLGLHNFNIDNLFKWVIKQVSYMRSSVRDIGRDSKSLIVEFMNANIGSTLVIASTNSKGAKPYAVTEPRNGLVIRNEVDNGHAYIARDVFRMWLTSNGADYTAIKRDLLESGVLLQENARKTLGANSNLGMTGQSYCWLIDIKHRDMAGSLLTEVAKVSDIEEIKVGVK